MKQFVPEFDSVKDLLYNQYEDVTYKHDTGLDSESLNRRVEAHLESNHHLPRVVQRAQVFSLLARQARITMLPFEWFPTKFDHQGLLRSMTRQWMGEMESGPLAAAAASSRTLYQHGLARAGLDTGHISPGWERMFDRGLTGLSERARSARIGLAEDDPRVSFYQAVETVYDAAAHLSNRFADLAENLAPDAPEYRDRLKIVAATCRRVPAHAPETFQEALQFAFFMHEIIETEGEMVRSMGHFDRVFYPYYRRDIDDGVITRDQAKELLKYFWYKWYSRTRGIHNGKNFLFGGQDGDGNTVENELTYLALEAYGELDVPDPKLSVRFTPETSDSLYRTCAELIRAGRNSFVLLSDEPAVQSLLETGKSIEDARCYLPIGCYEPAVDGKEAGCTMNIIVNIPKAVELMLNDGIDPVSKQRLGPATGDPGDFSDFGEVMTAFEGQLSAIIIQAVTCTAEYERAWPSINPSPIIAGTIEGCLEKGKDVGEGGPVYNSVGCVGLGLASACDALLAIKQAVFDEQRLDMPELAEVLRTNFADAESLRQYLVNRVPKWGNGNSQSDELGVGIAHFYSKQVLDYTNGRGGRVQPALFSLRHCVEFGAVTGALPDGRFSGSPLSAGVGAVTGQDRTGITALLNSVTGIDYARLPNGSVLDVTIHPSAVSGESGLTAFVHLIRQYFEAGGFGIQFNVVDADTLRKAQDDPETYASLQIRVTGWSARFVTLDRNEQDEYIARIAHRV